METSGIQPTSTSEKMHSFKLRTRKKRHTFKTCDKIIALSQLNEFATLSNGKKIVRFKACTEWLNKNLPGTFAKVTAKHLFNWHHTTRQQPDQASQSSSQLMSPTQSFVKSRGRKCTLMEVEMEQLKQALVLRHANDNWHDPKCACKCHGRAPGLCCGLQ